MKKFLTFIFFSLFVGSVCFGQDYSFSNHNIVPFCLNPSLVGNANAPRVSLNYRLQWPTLGNRYNTIRVSYDQNFYKRMCSLGAFYTFDDMANGSVRTNEFGLIYGHTIRLKENHFIRLGLQGSIFYNFYGDDFIYGDQYDDGTGTIVPNTSETIQGEEHVCFLDFAFGATYVWENHLTFGVSAYHITQPENGIIEKEKSRLDCKYVAHANFVQNISNGNGLFGRRSLSDRYFFLNASYQNQKDFEQIYGGIGLFLSPVIFGVSAKYDLDDVYIYSPLIGFTYKNLQIYYVFDLFTGSKKNGSWSNELSLIYVFNKHEKYPCPVVYW